MIVFIGKLNIFWIKDDYRIFSMKLVIDYHILSETGTKNVSMEPFAAPNSPNRLIERSYETVLNYFDPESAHRTTL